mgnify:CR=1 FL=1
MRSIGILRLFQCTYEKSSCFVFRIWLLMRSLLKEKENIQKLRFWGKIFGLQNDYYIFEVESEYVQHEVEEETESLENEINPKIFFVTTERKILEESLKSN